MKFGAETVAFWLLGLLNNSVYVIMIAGANDISSGAVGLVYFCAVFPALLVKLSAPYWFHLISYDVRMTVVAVMMTGSYLTVAYGRHMSWQLLGVTFAAFQGGLGEASTLALCSLYDSRRALTLWSSGTGFAGVAGYTWVAVLHLWLGFTFRTTLLLANVTSVAWLFIYHKVLPPPNLEAISQLHTLTSRSESTSDLPQGTTASAADRLAADASLLGLEAESKGRLSRRQKDAADSLASRRETAGSHNSPAWQPNGANGMTRRASWLDLDHAASSEQPSNAALLGDEERGRMSTDGDAATSSRQQRPEDMAWGERLVQTVKLWPYLVPLVAVYFAEYAMQTGTWTAIGFPVTDPAARHRFYAASNWCYQLGVFVSRSSGLAYQATVPVLWLMPALQLLLLLFFMSVAVSHWIYNWVLLAPCLMTGLLGGAVYVNAFTLISRHVDPLMREFSLAAASLGDSLGIAFADVAGVLIQNGKLHMDHNLDTHGFIVF
ncbi:MAG: golgi integral membrane protein [Trebouxia sp. A1-2]|nr:MAG: golgi integral membrane protein [Trebouxia sp. A1-2]